MFRSIGKQTLPTSICVLAGAVALSLMGFGGIGGRKGERVTKIAFASSRDGEYAIYSMNADGTNPTRLTKGRQPAWSPDGTNIGEMGFDGVSWGHF